MLLRFVDYPNVMNFPKSFPMLRRVLCLGIVGFSLATGILVSGQSATVFETPIGTVHRVPTQPSGSFALVSTRDGVYALPVGGAPTHVTTYLVRTNGMAPRGDLLQQLGNPIVGSFKQTVFAAEGLRVQWLGRDGRWMSTTLASSLSQIHDFATDGNSCVFVVGTEGSSSSLEFFRTQDFINFTRHTLQTPLRAGSPSLFRYGNRFILTAGQADAVLRLILESTNLDTWNESDLPDVPSNGPFVLIDIESALLAVRGRGVASLYVKGPSDESLAYSGIQVARDSFSTDDNISFFLSESWNQIAYSTDGLSWSRFSIPPVSLPSGVANFSSARSRHMVRNGRDLFFGSPMHFIRNVFDRSDDIPVSPGAVATPRVVNGFVVEANLITGGYGYTEPPLVLISGGGGSNASAEAVIQDGYVSEIRILNPGSGYTSTPKIVIAAPPFAPTLDIRLSKVTVTLRVGLGGRYVLQTSNNLTFWTDVGQPFVAESEVYEFEVDYESRGKYFRVAVFPE